MNLKVMQRNFIRIWLQFCSLHWCRTTGGPISTQGVLRSLIIKVTEEVSRRKQIVVLRLKMWSLPPVCHLLVQQQVLMSDE